MRVIDFTPYVLGALVRAGGSANQGALTEAVWGSSGRGNRTLVNSLFPFMERKGWITIRRAGRSIVYSLTEAGREAAGPLGKTVGHRDELWWVYETDPVKGIAVLESQHAFGKMETVPLADVEKTLEPFRF